MVRKYEKHIGKSIKYNNLLVAKENGMCATYGTYLGKFAIEDDETDFYNLKHTEYAGLCAEKARV